MALTPFSTDASSFYERYMPAYGLDLDSVPHIPMRGMLGWTGAAGMRAIHIDLELGIDTSEVVGVAAIDTTANMDVTVTSQWASAKVANTLSLYQGFMEYKN